MAKGPRLLLDEHIPPDTAAGLVRIRPAVEITCVRDWHGGTLIGAPDDVLLSGARDEGLTLVTYDQKTVRPLLTAWGLAGRAHAGVIFIDGRTCRPADIGGLVRSLARALDETASDDWTNCVAFLKFVEP